MYEELRLKDQIHDITSQAEAAGFGGNADRVEAYSTPVPEGAGQLAMYTSETSPHGLVRGDLTLIEGTQSHHVERVAHLQGAGRRVVGGNETTRHGNETTTRALTTEEAEDVGKAALEFMSLASEEALRQKAA